MKTLTMFLTVLLPTVAFAQKAKVPESQLKGPAKPAPIAQMNFYNDFRNRVESACGGGALGAGTNCLEGIVDREYVRRNVENKFFFILTGLGGDMPFSQGDYYDRTTIETLKDLGVSDSNIKTIVEPSEKDSGLSARDICKELTNRLDRLEHKDERIIFLGHSKAGRVILRMAYEKCPQEMGSKFVQMMMIAQPAIGPSPLANLTEQTDNGRWNEAQKKCGKTSKWPAWFATKTAAVIAPELGKHVDVVTKGRINYESCPTCKKKFLIFTSTWEKSCDPARVFGHDTQCFVELGNGPNDMRLPLDSQIHERAGRVVAHGECTGHSDFFKLSAYPGHIAYQQAANLWLFQEMFRAIGAK